jgi:O-antigen/teichoic acid export membrane protein
MTSAPPSSRPLETARDDATTRDAVIAVKSTLMLGASLVATWSVALVVRLFLPRYLGPEAFGVFNFAESFAAASFVILGLGVETYIQKEIPVRPAHASDFFGGVIAVRLMMSAGVFAAMAAVMAIAHRPAATQRVVFVFGAAQLLVSLNWSLSALLHATRAVSGLALVNVASKVLWGGCVALTVALGPRLESLALAFVAAEAARALVLGRLVRRHLGLRLRLDPRAVKVVILASLPFYLNQVAYTIYSKLDVSVLSVLSSDAEVGFYGSAQNLAGLALLLSPLFGSVLLPLLSRAASRSKEELYAILRRVVEAVMILVLPVSLLMGAGADVWIPGLFGGSFAPATLGLRVLAPVFVFTYLAMMGAITLVLLERAWTVAIVSFAGLAVNLTLNVALVPWALRSLGPGGAGVGAATALLLSEIGVTIALTTSIGKAAFDRALLAFLAKVALGYVAVIALDRALRPLGPARLAIDAAAYAALLVGSGAVKLAELGRLARFVLDQRRRHARE